MFDVLISFTIWTLSSLIFIFILSLGVPIPSSMGLLFLLPLPAALLVENARSRRKELEE